MYIRECEKIAQIDSIWLRIIASQLTTTPPSINWWEEVRNRDNYIYHGHEIKRYCLRVTFTRWHFEIVYFCCDLRSACVRTGDTQHVETSKSWQICQLGIFIIDNSHRFSFLSMLTPTLWAICKALAQIFYRLLNLKSLSWGYNKLWLRFR